MNQLDDRVLRAIRRLIHAADSHSKRVERSAGMTVPQLVVLKTLRDGGETTTNTLANRVSLSPPTLVPILDKLERRGLIARRRGTTDRRNVFVDLTVEGEAAIAAAPKPLDMRFLERFGALDPRRQATLVGALEEIVELMAPLLVPDRIIADAPPPLPEERSTMPPAKETVEPASA